LKRNVCITTMYPLAVRQPHKTWEAVLAFLVST
jgi:hypothetical protein